MAFAHEPGRTMGAFPPTDEIWSLVQRAQGDAQDTACRIALGQLLTRYLPPLRAHLVRQKRLEPHRAEDILQGFIAGKILEQQLIAKADRERGRFRTFLLSALENYLRDVMRHEKAACRNPGTPMAQVDDHLDAAAVPESAAFDAAWARLIIDQAVAQMRRECEQSKRMDLWEVFDGRILKPCLEDAEPVGYEELVTRLNLASCVQAGNLQVTAKRMFKRCLETVVREYARSPDETETELADLLRLMAKG